MIIYKWPEKLSLAQGYPSNGELLKQDIDALSKHYGMFMDPNTDPTCPKDADAKKLKDIKAEHNDVKNLVVGKACDAVSSQVSDVMTNVVAEFKALQKPKLTTAKAPDITWELGPLKRIERIMQKAVHYAVDPKNNSSTLMLHRVCDILRGTVVLPSYTLWKEGFGAQMIDLINKVFHGSVVQVKNRFILQAYPPVREYNGKWTKNGLGEAMIDLIENGLLGRDSFYRDLALLIKLDDKTFPNKQGLSHVYFELQLATKELHDAKTEKKPNQVSGHQAYKLVRTIMEHAEYQMWTNNGKETPALANAMDYYPLPSEQDWHDFEPSVRVMWDLYRQSQKYLITPMWKAINDSDWYGKDNSGASNSLAPS